MIYDPKIHHRRSIRLKEYDYSQCGAYFINICTKNRKCYFEKYSALKNIVKTEWENIPNRYPHIALDEYVIMPDHFHGIIFVGAGLAPAQNNVLHDRLSGATARVAPTIGDIVGSFKSRCVVEWLKYIFKNDINELGKFWQRNYYEHIIRNENELNRIREYIINNPVQWELNQNQIH